MEYLEKSIWKGKTWEDIKKLKVEPPKETVRRQVLDNWDHIAKPLDGMGYFETLTAQIGAIQGTAEVDISKRAILILCSDNGIVEEGISQSGQEVTLAVMKNMAEGMSSVGKMAKAAHIDTIPVDIGVNSVQKVPGVWDRKLCLGTRNFKLEPAMTEEEAAAAVFTGIELVSLCKEKGYGILGAGEMGIGNTTTSSAVTASLLGCHEAEVTGRGAGLSDHKLCRKQQIIGEAIEKYDLKHAHAFRVLQTVGGLDIAGLAGVCIGGALYHIPIVLDGFITLAAALAAERMVPGVKQYLIPSHQGREPGAQKLLDTLGLVPVIHGAMALGEGTGAVMMIALLDLAHRIYEDGTTFSCMDMEPYERFGQQDR